MSADSTRTGRSLLTRVRNVHWQSRNEANSLLCPDSRFDPDALLLLETDERLSCSTGSCIDLGLAPVR